MPAGNREDTYKAGKRLRSYVLQHKPRKLFV